MIASTEASRHREGRVTAQRWRARPRATAFAGDAHHAAAARTRCAFIAGYPSQKGSTLSCVAIETCVLLEAALRPPQRSGVLRPGKVLPTEPVRDGDELHVTRADVILPLSWARPCAPSTYDKLI